MTTQQADGTFSVGDRVTYFRRDTGRRAAGVIVALDVGSIDPWCVRQDGADHDVWLGAWHSLVHETPANVRAVDFRAAAEARADRAEDMRLYAAGVVNALRDTFSRVRDCERRGLPTGLSAHALAALARLREEVGDE